MDRGYDYVRSKEQHSLSIGISESNGNIDNSLEYWWGWNECWLCPSPSETFEILLNKQGYKERRVYFKASDLEIYDGKIIVPLGSVYLEKI